MAQQWSALECSQQILKPYQGRNLLKSVVYEEQLGQINWVLGCE